MGEIFTDYNLKEEIQKQEKTISYTRQELIQGVRDIGLEVQALKHYYLITGDSETEAEIHRLTKRGRYLDSLLGTTNETFDL